MERGVARYQIMPCASKVAEVGEERCDNNIAGKGELPSGMQILCTHVMPLQGQAQIAKSLKMHFVDRWSFVAPGLSWMLEQTSHLSARRVFQEQGSVHCLATVQMYEGVIAFRLLIRY